MTSLVKTGSNSRERFTQADLEMFLTISDELTTIVPDPNAAKKKFSYDSIPINSKKETPLQKRVLELFDALGDLPDSLCIKLLEVQVSYVLRAGEPLPNQDFFVNRFPK